MFNLGSTNELLNNPAIRLCLDWGRCTNACSQLVEVRELIRRLKGYRAILPGSAPRRRKSIRQQSAYVN